MKLSTTNRRATVHDVAREAKVSLATVDRVLNKRPGVRPATVERVEQAVEALGFQRDLGASLMARSREFNVRFLLPDGANPFIHNLREAVTASSAEAAQSRIRVSTGVIPALDAQGQAAALEALRPEDCDCVVIAAADTRHMREAIAAVRKRDIVVITLVSDLPGSARQHFVGIDNVAAGRTAASLMGRFCRSGETVGLLIGSMTLRDHAERLDGFREVMAREFPAIAIRGPFEGADDARRTEQALHSLLSAAPGLAGIYSIGAGNEGIMQALMALPEAQRPVVIAHELTTLTRKGLADGVIDVVLDQNPHGEITRALSIAKAIARDSVEAVTHEPIEIGIFLRDNLTRT